MPHPSLEKFTVKMDRLVGTESDPHLVSHTTASYLTDLLSAPQFLEERFRQPSETGYQQHVIHVHPEGLYSVVALIWLPGQATPVHDHRCWCVVGVLEGREHQTRFHLYEDERSETRFLKRLTSETFSPGDVCGLVPPEEDIHVVSNNGYGLGISIHIYGADISRLGSSINHTFELPVYERLSPRARRIRWRDFDSTRIDAT